MGKLCMKLVPKETQGYIHWTKLWWLTGSKPFSLVFELLSPLLEDWTIPSTLKTIVLFLMAFVNLRLLISSVVFYKFFCSISKRKRKETGHDGSMVCLYKSIFAAFINSTSLLCVGIIKAKTCGHTLVHPCTIIVYTC